MLSCEGEGAAAAVVRVADCDPRPARAATAERQEKVTGRRLSNIVENVACTVCGCVCDDLRITVADNAVAHTQGACRLAEPWFRALGASRPPAVSVDGRPAT